MFFSWKDFALDSRMFVLISVKQILVLVYSNSTIGKFISQPVIETGNLMNGNNLNVFVTSTSKDGSLSLMFSMITHYID